jgi:hypothetical protein
VTPAGTPIHAAQSRSPLCPWTIRPPQVHPPATPAPSPSRRVAPRANCFSRPLRVPLSPHGSRPRSPEQSPARTHAKIPGPAPFNHLRRTPGTLTPHHIRHHSPQRPRPVLPPEQSLCAAVEPPFRRTGAPTKSRSSVALSPGNSPRHHPSTPGPARAEIFSGPRRRR